MAITSFRHGAPVDLWGSLERVQGDRRNDFAPSIHTEDVEHVLGRFDACIRDGGCYELVYRVVDKDQVRTLKCNSVTYKNSDGSERYAHAAHITELRALKSSCALL
jgi:PAS fold